MTDKKYKLLRNFTPRDLYEAQAPIELFLKCKERRMGYIDLPFYHTQRDFVEYGQSIVSAVLVEYEPWLPWLIENKFIKEYEKDSLRDLTTLTPGMILRDSITGFEYLMTNNGLYCGKGFTDYLKGTPSIICAKCKTLQELNKKSGSKWDIIY